MTTTILKMRLHCERCSLKVKKLLMKINGVSSVTADVKQGRVTVVSTVDPRLLVDALSKAGIIAELVNMEIVAHSKPGQNADQRMIAQLRQLSEIQHLQNVEVTYSTTIKLSFKGPEEDKAVYVNGPQSVYLNGPSSGGSRMISKGENSEYSWDPPPGGFTRPSTPLPPPPWQQEVPSAPPLEAYSPSAAYHSYPYAFTRNRSIGCNIT